MTELEKIRAHILERRDAAMRTVEREQRTVDCMVAELEAHDRAVAAMGLQPEADDGPHRRSIQRPVMALFTPERGVWSEDAIVKETALPVEAVHKFLLRAVEKGMLRRVGIEYALPQGEPE